MSFSVNEPQECMTLLNTTLVYRIFKMVSIRNPKLTMYQYIDNVNNVNNEYRAEICLKNTSWNYWVIEGSCKA